MESRARKLCRRCASHSEAALRCDRPLQKLRVRGLLWNGLAGRRQILDVESYRLLGVGQAFLNGFALRDAARQGWHGHAEATLRVGVHNDRVGSHGAPPLQQIQKLVDADSRLIQLMR